MSTVDETLDLVRKAKKGDQRAIDHLIKSLESDIRKVASRYYINGADYNDVVQEGRIGAWKAIMDFDESGGMAFRNFAVNLCIKRHIITCMAAANRKKFDPLNSAVSIDTPINTDSEDNDQTLSDFIQDPKMPALEELVILEEYGDLAQEVVKRLTQLEYAVFLEYIVDGSYKDIADALGLNSKCIDNSLMRVRRKASEVYTEYNQKMALKKA